jgi:hypothetical protein
MLDSTLIQNLVASLVHQVVLIVRQLAIVFLARKLDSNLSMEFVRLFVGMELLRALKLVMIQILFLEMDVLILVRSNHYGPVLVNLQYVLILDQQFVGTVSCLKDKLVMMETSSMEMDVLTFAKLNQKILLTIQTLHMG